MRPETEALIVVDVQNDFCPGGALAVAGGDAIIPAINAMMPDFRVVILTKDWHPPNHTSFADNHPGLAPFTDIDMPYGRQTLWPAHCVWGSAGAEFHDDLDTNRADLVLRKGFRAGIDSYSSFFENDKTTPTGLAGYLKDRGIAAVTLVGLAADFCVAYSAYDAARLGLSVRVIEGATRAIDLNGSHAVARARMLAAGVRLEA